MKIRYINHYTEEKIEGTWEEVENALFPLPDRWGDCVRSIVGGDKHYQRVDFSTPEDNYTVDLVSREYPAERAVEVVTDRYLRGRLQTSRISGDLKDLLETMSNAGCHVTPSDWDVRDLTARVLEKLRGASLEPNPILW